MQDTNLLEHNKLPTPIAVKLFALLDEYNSKMFPTKHQQPQNRIDTIASVRSKSNA